MAKQVKERASVHNKEVGRRLGLTHTAISRIRSGKRLPSIATMRQIQLEYHWSIEAQTVRHGEGGGAYGRAFERMLVNYYGTEDE